ncbi:hypothetical protein [uncultured Bacteroides sp.]|uniref:hypothetical protein n=1 Tax=uncultured Bacteroides sp. TaxID=162156 RepID=UPI002AAAC6EE|nr:hypothetical protein [uncultured Bacteroides sp.]
MKKIIFTLVAIMMASMSSVSMASNKGGYINDNRHEIRVEDYEHYRNRDNRNDDRRYEETKYYNYRDNRDRDNWDQNDRDREYRECQDRDYRHHERKYSHKDNDAKVVGTIIGAAALLILATSH